MCHSLTSYILGGDPRGGCITVFRTVNVCLKINLWFSSVSVWSVVLSDTPPGMHNNFSGEKHLRMRKAYEALCCMIMTMEAALWALFTSKRNWASVLFMGSTKLKANKLYTHPLRGALWEYKTSTPKINCLQKEWRHKRNKTLKKIFFLWELETLLRGVYLTVLGVYPWLWTHRSLLGVLRRPYGRLGIGLTFTACQASALPSVLWLWSSCGPIS